MIELAVLVTLATLIVGLVVAFGLSLLPTLRMQLVGLAFLAVVLPLGAVLLSGWVMFHMGDDVKIHRPAGRRRDPRRRHRHAPRILGHPCSG